MNNNMKDFSEEVRWVLNNTAGSVVFANSEVYYDELNAPIMSVYGNKNKKKFEFGRSSRTFVVNFDGEGETSVVEIKQ